MASRKVRPIRVEGNVAYVPLTQGREAMVDVVDAHLVSGLNWSAVASRDTFYAVANRPGRGNGIIRMHRVLIDCPDGMHVDHIDGNGLNNTRGNLRVATNGQNQCNRGKSPRNTSGFKGVNWSRRHKKWNAQISVGGKNRSLGHFDDPGDAHAAYCAASQRFHGEFGRAE